MLAGKTALVTGASKGVGKGIALALARAGCDVAVNYHSNEAGARSTAAEIESLGRKALVVGGHVGRSQDVDAMLARAVSAFGRLHIWVNNAGVQTWKSLLDLDEAEWDRVITTNLKGTFLCTQRAARHMKEFGGGRAPQHLPDSRALKREARMGLDSRREPFLNPPPNARTALAKSRCLP